MVTPMFAVVIANRSLLQTRVDVTLDTTETIGKDIEIVDASFPAVLVRRDSAGGAVYVSGPGTPKEEPRVRTGPDQPRGAVILVIKPGQTCVVLGQPSVRYFRPRSSS